MSFEFVPLDLPGVVLVRARMYHDERGFFREMFRADEFRAAGLPDSFVQDNHSLSRRGVVRGLHYQLPPKAQGKLITVVAGAAWDVLVDLRPASPTFRRWAALELREGDGVGVYVPPGFAHGFAALADGTHLVYKCSAVYDPSLDTGIRWNDPELAIPWPVRDPVVSAKDASLPTLAGAQLFTV
mgnify:CR=1 FL=1